jgi:hypothetical protein
MQSVGVRMQEIICLECHGILKNDLHFLPGLKYEQVRIAKEKSEGQLKLEKFPPRLRILMDMCGKKVRTIKMYNNLSCYN